MPMKKQSMVVILGAGASSDWVPSTSVLTRLLCDTTRVDEPAVHTFRRAKAGLDRQAAEASPLGQHLEPPWFFEDLFAYVLATEYRRYLADGKCADRAATYSAEVVNGLKAIACAISEPTASVTSPSLDALFEVLAEAAMPLTVATLNWDDLITRVHVGEPWYDGFDRRGRSPRPFDEDFHRSLGSHPYGLLWLHGSLQWRRTSGGDWVWDDRHLTTNLDRLLPNRDEWIHVDDWAAGLSFDPYDQALPRFPVVISPAKEQQLFQRIWLGYWSALAESLREAQTLLIIGYSGGDDHLNAVIREAIQDSPLLRRIIWIDYSPHCAPDVTALRRRWRKTCGEGWTTAFLDPSWNSCSEFPFLRWHHEITSSLPSALDSWLYLRGLQKLNTREGQDALRRLLQGAS